MNNLGNIKIADDVVKTIAAKAVPIEVCIKIDWSTDGAKR